jgi:hypothetical protein
VLLHVFGVVLRCLSSVRGMEIKFGDVRNVSRMLSRVNPLVLAIDSHLKRTSES